MLQSQQRPQLTHTGQGAKIAFKSYPRASLVVQWLRIQLVHPTPVFFPGKVHGQKSLAGCSPWGYITEHACMRVEGDG